MSTPRPGVSPLRRAPAPNSVRPRVRQRVRPHRSVSFPPGIMSAAITSRSTPSPTRPQLTPVAVALSGSSPPPVSATTTRWGEFTTFGTTSAADQTYGAKWTLDLAATYTLADSWSFTVGGDNVTNEYPDRSVAGVGTRTYLPYSTQSPFGFNGAFVYGKIGYKW